MTDEQRIFAAFDKLVDSTSRTRAELALAQSRLAAVQAMCATLEAAAVELHQHGRPDGGTAMRSAIGYIRAALESQPHDH